MRVVGRPRDGSFRAGSAGRFRTGPRKSWMKCEAWQYNSYSPVARIFHIRIRLAGVLPVLARDTYQGGHGRMLVRLFDLLTLADGRGDEYDIGELVTWLNDAVLIAPSMLLGPAVTWAADARDCFDVSLTDSGRTVTARVSINDNGQPVDFSTNDRFCYNPDDPRKLIRARWTTPVSEWQILEGRPVPKRAQAVWHLEQGPFAYADLHLRPGTMAFNVQPGS